MSSIFARAFLEAVRLDLGEKPPDSVFAIVAVERESHFLELRAPDFQTAPIQLQAMPRRQFQVRGSDRSRPFSRSRRRR